MSRDNILHVGGLDKFIGPFVDFLAAQPDFDRHCFFFWGDAGRYRVKKGQNVVLISGSSAQLAAIKMLVQRACRADKIIIHGLFNLKLIIFLLLQPWLLKRCYWVIWGGDLYQYQSRQRDWRWRRNEILRRFVIQRIGHLVTFVKGDVELARKWYGAKGAYHECFMYPSNVFRGYPGKGKRKGTCNIQVGNSASTSNNHLEVLKALEKYKGEDIRIFVPLSYGDMEYAARLIEEGVAMFGEKFVPLLDFMPLQEYQSFLAGIDVVLFNHDRQQGMGNLITLLGYGKKVFMRPETSAAVFFRSMGVTIFDIRKLDLFFVDAETQVTNQLIIRKHFSSEVLADQLKALFAA